METSIRYFLKFLAIAIAYLVMIECTLRQEQHMNMVVFRVVDTLIKLLVIKINKIKYLFILSSICSY